MKKIEAIIKPFKLDDVKKALNDAGKSITQINEATLSFLPKLVAVSVTLVVIGPWMLSPSRDRCARPASTCP